MLQVFLVLYAAAKNAIMTETRIIPLQYNFSGTVDWEAVVSLLSINGIEFQFKNGIEPQYSTPSNVIHSGFKKARQSANAKTAAHESALYLLYAKSAAYIGLSRNGNIPKFHDRKDELGMVSLDTSSCGDFLRSEKITQFYRKVFAIEDKSDDTMYESCAILTLGLGLAHKVKCEVSGVTRVVNKRLDFYDYSFNTFSAMQGCSYHFFNSQLYVSIANDCSTSPTLEL